MIDTLLIHMDISNITIYLYNESNNNSSNNNNRDNFKRIMVIIILIMITAIVLDVGNNINDIP